MFLRSCIIINLNGVSSLCLIWWWVWGRGERWECRFSKWCMCLCVLVIQASHKYHRVECQKGHIERSEFRDLGKKMTTVKWINVAGLEYFIIMILELPWGINGQESTCQCRRRVQSLGREDALEKEWQPTAVFLPGESPGQRSLAGHSKWGPKEPDMT